MDTELVCRVECQFSARLAPVPIYTAWWTEEHVCEQLVQRCTWSGAAGTSNLRPIGCRSDTLTTPLRHTARLPKKIQTKTSIHTRVEVKTSILLSTKWRTINNCSGISKSFRNYNTYLTPTTLFVYLHDNSNKNLAIANRSRVSCINTNNNTMTLKSGLEVTQGHWKWYYLKAWVRFPIRLL